VGDGIDNPHGSDIIHPDMKPSPGFKYSLCSTKVPGDELSVVGEYSPNVGYEAQAAFEARGCPVR